MATLEHQDTQNNGVQAQEHITLQGSPLECLDSSTLDFIKKVFPPPASGLEFAALLLQQTEQRQNLPGEIAKLGENSAVIRPQTIRQLAKKIGWGYDTTHKYIVTFKALGLLHRYRYSGETFWLFPLTAYTPPTLEALDQLIAQSRPKVQQFARHVRERFYLSRVATTPCPPAAPKPTGGKDPTAIHVKKALEHIYGLLQEANVDAGKGWPLALRITAEVIAMLAETPEAALGATIEQEVSSHVARLSAETEKVSHQVVPAVDLSHPDTRQRKVAPQKSKETQYARQQGQTSSERVSGNRQGGNSLSKGRREIPAAPRKVHAATQEGASRWEGETSIQTREKEVAFSIPARGKRGDFNASRDTFGAQASGRVDYVSQRVDSAPWGMEKEEDLAGYQGDSQEDFGEQWVDQSTTAVSNWQVDSDATWEDFSQVEADRAARAVDFSGSEVSGTVDLSLYPPEFARDYVTLSIIDLFYKTHRDVTLRKALQMFFAQVFDGDQSKLWCYKGLLNEQDTDAIIAGFINTLACLYRPGGESIENPGAFFITQCRTAGRRGKVAERQRPFIEQHMYMTYEDMIEKFKRYTKNQKRHCKTSKSSDIPFSTVEVLRLLGRPEEEIAAYQAKGGGTVVLHSQKYLDGIRARGIENVEDVGIGVSGDEENNGWLPA